MILSASTVSVNSWYAYGVLYKCINYIHKQYKIKILATPDPVATYCVTGSATAWPLEIICQTAFKKDEEDHLPSQAG